MILYFKKGEMYMNAFELYEKYNDYSIRANKIKKIQLALKDNKEIQDSTDVLKELQKECLEKSSKIKEVLEGINVDDIVL